LQAENGKAKSGKGNAFVWIFWRPPAFSAAGFGLAFDWVFDQAIVAAAFRPLAGLSGTNSSRLRTTTKSLPARDLARKPLRIGIS
jgi:hypothetical protein